MAGEESKRHNAHKLSFVPGVENALSSHVHPALKQPPCGPT